MAACISPEALPIATHLQYRTFPERLSSLPSASRPQKRTRTLAEGNSSYSVEQLNSNSSGLSLPPACGQSVLGASGAPRPLPPLPSSPHLPTRVEPLRRLPHPPPSSENVPVFITPPTPLLSPPLEYSRSKQSLRPIPSPGRNSNSPLTLQTSFSLSTPHREEDTYPSPLPPDIPQAPSPMTAKRKRYTKLNRHLGESVPYELVYGPSHPLPHLKLDEVPEEREYHSSQDALYNPMKNIGNESDSSVEDNADEADYTWIMSNGMTRQELSKKRYSKKWIRERGGQRWIEEDYTHVLKALRTL